MLKYILLALLSLPVTSAFAEDIPPELESFGDFSDILPVEDAASTSQKKRSSKNQTIIPYIASAIQDAAVYNIQNAEQVFCYRVVKRPKDYTGYTLNNFAVSGYCGELDNSQTATTYEALFTQSPNIITVPSSCRIEPKIMLRFARGVDYTDILLSSPCPSFTVFYAGKYKAFNIKQGIIDDIISQFNRTDETFNSPTLLKQTVANAKAETSKEQEQLEKKQRENAPLMAWQKPQTPSEPKLPGVSAPVSSSKTETSAPKGWGNLKLNM